MARRDYNELLPWFVTSQTLINPAPGNMQQRVRGHAVLLYRRGRVVAMPSKLGVREKSIYMNRFCLLTILMDSQVSNQCSKAAVLNLAPCITCFAHTLLCISLSLSHTPDSEHQLCSNNELFQLYTLCIDRYCHIAMRSVKHGRACGCCAV